MKECICTRSSSPLKLQHLWCTELFKSIWQTISSLQDTRTLDQWNLTSGSTFCSRPSHLCKRSLESTTHYGVDCTLGTLQLGVTMTTSSEGHGGQKIKFLGQLALGPASRLWIRQSMELRRSSISTVRSVNQTWSLQTQAKSLRSKWNLTSRGDMCGIATFYPTKIMRWWGLLRCCQMPDARSEKCEEDKR